MIRRLRVFVRDGMNWARPEAKLGRFARHRSPPPCVYKLDRGVGDVPSFEHVVRGAPLAKHVPIVASLLDEFALDGHGLALEGNELGCECGRSRCGLGWALGDANGSGDANEQASKHKVNESLTTEGIKTFLMLHRHRKTAFI